MRSVLRLATKASTEAVLCSVARRTQRQTRQESRTIINATRSICRQCAVQKAFTSCASVNAYHGSHLGGYPSCFDEVGTPHDSSERETEPSSQHDRSLPAFLLRFVQVPANLWPPTPTLTAKSNTIDGIRTVLTVIFAHALPCELCVRAPNGNARGASWQYLVCDPPHYFRPGFRGATDHV